MHSQDSGVLSLTAIQSSTLLCFRVLTLEPTNAYSDSTGAVSITYEKAFRANNLTV
jgi:hypothetical protein